MKRPRLHLPGSGELLGARLGARLDRVQRVRNQVTGRVLPCCWDVCERDGDDRYGLSVPHDAPRFKGEQLRYVFCSPAHAAYWKNSHRDRGNVPTGSRGLLGPLGLPIG